MLRVFKWVGICVAVLVVGVVSLPFLINVNQFKPMLESDLRSTLTRTTGNGATAPARCHDASTRSLRSDPQAGQMQATCASAFRPRRLPISAGQAFDSGIFTSVVSRNIWGLLNSSKPLSLD
jgi:hypothetical protein